LAAKSEIPQGADVILAAGLTPAWQQILVFDLFTPGEVNRAREIHWCASGKVLNAARVLHNLGGSCKALTLVGGTPGTQIQQDFAQLGISARWIQASAATRVCTTILDTSQNTATELVPNASEITAAERDAFVAAFAEETVTVGVTVLIGSLPVGTPSNFYKELLSRTPGKAILDARDPELLEALQMEPFLIKPNRDELAVTVGRDLSTNAALFDAMSEMNQRGAEWVVVTDGNDPVYASSGHELYQLQPPQREVVNPIGCGDCMAAGIAWAIENGREPLDAIRYGMAIAADKVGRMLPGMVDRGAAERFAPAIAVARL
jgi:tagatose 6-phosphate kinase